MMRTNQCSWIACLALTLAVLACNFPYRASPTPVAGTIQVPATPSPFSPLPSAAPTQQGAANLPAESPVPTSTLNAPLPAPTISYQPIFEPAPCAFYIPPGYNPACGYLEVPENRTRPDSPLIRLHVAVFRSDSPQRAADPVVHLAGGPGSSSLDLADYMFRQGLAAVLERRDLILFDQRGTGHSEPRLDCPEREAVAPLLLEGGRSSEETEQIVLDAFRACRERLMTEGVDLSAYNSAASAADVDDLRRILGYERLNLYGVSYGTRLALTIMRDYPEGVRSAVLDSSYPPEVNLYTALAPNAERAFNAFFQGCASDPECSAAYPDLGAVFYDLVNQLEASPVTVSLAAGGAERSVAVDGDLLIDVLFVGLYNPVVSVRMPEMIFNIRQGDYELLRERLRLYFEPSAALGMQMSVQCNEELLFDPPEAAYTEAQGVQPQIAAFFRDSVQPLFAACQEWITTPPDPLENQPVHSELPTLILGGEYDPITPPEWGRMTAGNLSNATFYEFPGHGHWVTRSSGCALSMALAFWEDPSSAPDASCITE